MIFDKNVDWRSVSYVLPQNNSRGVYANISEKLVGGLQPLRHLTGHKLITGFDIMTGTSPTLSSCMRVEGAAALFYHKCCV